MSKIDYKPIECALLAAGLKRLWLNAATCIAVGRMGADNADVEESIAFLQRIRPGWFHAH